MSTDTSPRTDARKPPSPDTPKRSDPTWLREHAIQKGARRTLRLMEATRSV